MNINYPQYNISFGAKNKSVRLADDLQRKARQTFPMVSSSYLDEFITSDSKCYQRKGAVTENLYRQIRDLRSDSFLRKPSGILRNAYILDLVKKRKCGNCAEAAKVSYAALVANGFTDSTIYSLYLKTQIINKHTGEVEYQALDSFDHNIVITTMGKNSHNQKDLVVVDGWLGFASSYSDTIARYKEIFPKESIKPILSKHMTMFDMKKANQGEKFSGRDYKTVYSFTFEDPEDYNEDYNITLSDYVKEHYPELIMPQCNQSNT